MALGVARATRAHLGAEEWQHARKERYDVSPRVGARYLQGWLRGALLSRRDGGADAPGPTIGLADSGISKASCPAACGRSI